MSVLESLCTSTQRSVYISEGIRYAGPLSGALTLGASCSQLRDFRGPCFFRRRWFSSRAGTEADFRRVPQGLTSQDLDSGTRRGRSKRAGLVPPGNPGTPCVETLAGVAANSMCHRLTPPPPPRAAFRSPLYTLALLQPRLSWGRTGSSPRGCKGIRKRNLFLCPGELFS